MNRFTSLLLTAGLVLLCTTGFTPKPTASKPTPSNPSPTAEKTRFTMYYWFLYPSDEWNDYASLADEETEWWFYYDGVNINTNPMGGTLIARGYPNGAIPHNTFPTVFLYAHFYY